MSVRNGLLALLAEHPAHGYGLKSEFEASTAGVWPLNVGQVYTTLGRLERDGLVEAAASDTGTEHARQPWRITEEGREALAEWYRSAVDERSSRDELVIKVLLAIAAESADVARILQNQRAAALRRLQEMTRHKREADPERELPWVLFLDALSLKTEAEIRWLDLCEERLEQSRGKRGRS